MILHELSVTKSFLERKHGLRIIYLKINSIYYFKTYFKPLILK